MRVLFVAASTDELSAVTLAHRQGCQTLVTGAGPISAAASLAATLAFHINHGGHVDLIVNVGLAGALKPQIPVGAIIRPDLAWEWDFDADKLSEIGFPSLNLRNLEHGSGDGFVVASGGRFIDNEKIREQLARSADVVDMEAYALAHVASAFDIPIQVVKAVSDFADDNASAAITSSEHAILELRSYMNEHWFASLQ